MSIYFNCFVLSSIIIQFSIYSIPSLNDPIVPLEVVPNTAYKRDLGPLSQLKVYYNQRHPVKKNKLKGGMISLLQVDPCDYEIPSIAQINTGTYIPPCPYIPSVPLIQNLTSPDPISGSYSFTLPQLEIDNSYINNNAAIKYISTHQDDKDLSVAGSYLVSMGGSNSAFINKIYSNVSIIPPIKYNQVINNSNYQFFNHVPSKSFLQVLDKSQLRNAKINKNKKISLSEMKMKDNCLYNSPMSPVDYSGTSAVTPCPYTPQYLNNLNTLLPSGAIDVVTLPQLSMDMGYTVQMGALNDLMQFAKTSKASDVSVIQGKNVLPSNLVHTVAAPGAFIEYEAGPTSVTTTTTIDPCSTYDIDSTWTPCPYPASY